MNYTENIYIYIHELEREYIGNINELYREYIYELYRDSI